MPSKFPKELINLLRTSNESLITLSEIEASFSRQQIAITAAEIAITEIRGGLAQAADPARQRELLRQMEADLAETIKDANEMSEILDRLNAPAMRLRKTVMDMIELEKENCVGCEGEERQKEVENGIRKKLKELRTQSKQFRGELDRLIDGQSFELSDSSDEAASEESEEEF
jgi:hypothetical protein